MQLRKDNPEPYLGQPRNDDGTFATGKQTKRARRLGGTKNRTVAAGLIPPEHASALE